MTQLAAGAEPAHTDKVSVTTLRLLRLGFAVLLLSFHGIARFTRAFDYVVHGEPWPFVDLVTRLGFPAAAAFAVASAMSESVGAAFVAAGLWTRAAAAAIASNMLVAIYNEGAKGDSIELPTLYLFGALLCALAGPGRFSLDRVRRRRARRGGPAL